LHDEADDLEHQIQHLLGGNVTGLLSKLQRVICSSQVGLVPPKEVCAAGLEQPSGFLWHEAQPDVKFMSSSQNGGVQVNIATIQKQQKRMR
jgi:hypothetical protein